MNDVQASEPVGPDTAKVAFDILANSRPLVRTASGDYEGDHTIRMRDHGGGLVQLRMSCGHKLMEYDTTPDGTEFSCPLCAKRVRVERKTPA